MPRAPRLRAPLRRGPSILARSALVLAGALLPPPSASAPPGDDSDAADDRRARILQAVADNRLEEARELLDRMLCERALGAAREDFAAGRPADGLLDVDRALEYRPDDADALLLRAEGAAQLAEAALAEGASAVFVEGAFEDALAAYRRVPAADPSVGPRVLLGASRAAYMLGRADEALELARRGLELVSSQGAEAADLAAPPERTWAEAAFLAYRTARADEARAEEAAELYAETEDALVRLLARTPDDPWVWTTLARLAQWEEDLGGATRRLQQGLDHLPTDAILLATLVEVAGADGPERVLAELDAFLGRHPTVAGGHWHRARARFDRALEALLAGEPAAAAFPAAEADFRRCRELAPVFAESCRAYEAMCRNGAGWAHYHAGELEAALEAFLSTEDVLEGGLAWAIEGQLLSGLQGLEFVAQAYNDAEDWAAAADVFDVLREEQPGEVKWANNAGFFHRDAAVQLELLGRRLCAAAEGDPLPEALAAELAVAHEGFGASPEECAALADAYLEEARERARKSYDAYLAAAELAPRDVRVVNDAALIAVYYLQEDLDRAERLLRRCIALGEEQLAQPGLSEEERFDLENAWGDAFQNLGVLYLAQRGDPETARGLFERCLDLGDARPLVRQRLLPLCDATPAEVAAADEQGLRPWAVPCR